MNPGVKITSDVKPPAKDLEIGVSMPMYRNIPHMSSVAVYDHRNAGGLKYVHIDSDKYIGKYLVMLFMDNQLTDPEIQEWKRFSDDCAKFKGLNAVVIGVATASHVAIRSWMMNRMSGIRFPIISDYTGEISRAFGVFDVNKGRSARGLIILSPSWRLAQHTLNNEYTFSDADQVLQLIRELKDSDSDTGEAILNRYNPYEATTVPESVLLQQQQQGISSGVMVPPAQQQDTTPGISVQPQQSEDNVSTPTLEQEVEPSQQQMDRAQQPPSRAILVPESNSKTAGMVSSPGSRDMQQETQGEAISNGDATTAADETTTGQATKLNVNSS